MNDLAFELNRLLFEQDYAVATREFLQILKSGAEPSAVADVLTKALSEDNFLPRLRAIQFFAYIPTELNKEIFSHVIADQSWVVREAFADTLAKVDANDEVLSMLCKLHLVHLLLRDVHAFVRKNAIRGLKQMGEPFELINFLLRSALQMNNESHCIRALQACAEIPEVAVSMPDLIEDFLTCPGAKLRLNATRASRHLRERNILLLLVRRLHDGDKRVRAAAAESLEYLATTLPEHDARIIKIATQKKDLNEIIEELLAVSGNDSLIADFKATRKRRSEWHLKETKTKQTTEKELAWQVSYFVEQLLGETKAV